MKPLSAGAVVLLVSLLATQLLDGEPPRPVIERGEDRVEVTNVPQSHTVLLFGQLHGTTASKRRVTLIEVLSADDRGKFFVDSRALARSKPLIVVDLETGSTSIAAEPVGRADNAAQTALAPSVDDGRIEWVIIRPKTGAWYLKTTLDTEASQRDLVLDSAAFIPVTKLGSRFQQFEKGDLLIALDLVAETLTEYRIETPGATATTSQGQTVRTAPSPA